VRKAYRDHGKNQDVDCGRLAELDALRCKAYVFNQCYGAVPRFLVFNLREGPMNSFRSLIAVVFAGLGVMAVGACGPATGATCSPDHHQIISAANAASNCLPTEACVVSTSKVSGCAKCDPTLCLQGNDCILGWTRYEDYLKGDKTTQNTECRLKCSVPTDCP